jgi:ribosomal protein S18 acetylase RimI-like enzyme
MKVVSRDYNPDGSDFKQLCLFIVGDNALKKEYFIWQLGRMVDWKYGLWNQHKFFPTFFSKNARLWLNYCGELVGFAISESGGGDFSIFVQEAYIHIYEEILQWVVENWRDRDNTLQTELNEVQVYQRQILEQYGFTAGEGSEITRVFDLKNREASHRVLEDGFKIVDMASHYDPVGKAKLQLNAFRNRDNVEEIDLLAREYVRESPIYRAAFDISILNPQGEHVAGCEAFIDYQNGVAEIERVCTHNAYRRKGLARVVIEDCFQRLQAHGVYSAYITGWNEATNNLYGNLGHRKEVIRNHYELSKS